MLWTLYGVALPLIAAQVEFNRDIRPIFSDRCFSCHGPDPANRKTKMRLDQEAGAKSVIVAGDPEKSEIFRRIPSTAKAPRIPPPSPRHDNLPHPQLPLPHHCLEA